MSTTRGETLLPPVIFILSRQASSVSAFRSSSGLDFEVIPYDHDHADAKLELNVRLLAIFEQSTSLNQQVLLACTSIGSDDGLSSVKVTDVDIASVINIALQLFFDRRPKARLSNVVILHETDDLHHVVFNYKQHVRSITNIIFTSDARTSDGYLLNRHLAPRLRTVCGEKITTSMPDLDNRRFSYRHMCEAPRHDPVEFHVEETWWYKLFDSIPRCAEGRLTQQTATCWWDSTMNSLLLSQTAAEMMRRKWHTLAPADQETCKRIGLRNCPVADMPYETFVYILIYHILIKGSRARTFEPQQSAVPGQTATSWSLAGKDAPHMRGNDISSRGALYIAHALNASRYNPQTGHARYFKASGGKALEGLQVIAGRLFEKGPQYNMIETTVSEADKIQEDAPLRFETDEDFFSCMEQNQSRWENLGALVLGDRYRAFLLNPHPQIVILANSVRGADKTMMRAPEAISVNGRTYLLDTAVMRVPNHVVTGFSCADAHGVTERFLFDPNNILTKDFWPAAVMTDLAQEYSDRDVTLGEFMGFSYILYSLSDKEQTSSGQGKPQHRPQQVEWTYSRAHPTTQAAGGSLRSQCRVNLRRI